MEEKIEILEEKEEKKKNSKGLIIVIIILAITVLGLIGYISYDKFYSENKNTSTNNEIKEEEKEKKSIHKEENAESVSTEREDLSLNDETVQKLFKIFSNKRQYTKNLNNENKEKLRFAYENIDTNSFETISCSKVGGLVGERLCGDSAWVEKELVEAYSNGDWEAMKIFAENSRYTKALNSEILKLKMVELFGNDYPYQPEDFGSCRLIHYDAKNDIYAEYNGQCGEGVGAPCYETLVSAYKKGNNLYLETSFTDCDISKATYEFQKDVKNGNYVFAQVTTE